MEKLRILISILFAILIIRNGNAQNNLISEKQITDINQFIEKLSEQDRFSGTILIAKDNDILYQKSVGLSNKEKNIKNNINTKFNLASMNKMFTSVAIAQLVEKKELAYSDKVIKYLPYLPEMTFGKITIEQLLTHTSGLGDIFGNPAFFEIKDTAKTLTTYVNLCINDTLLFEPGSKFMYSNYAYILLGAIIEQISKTNYFQYVKKNIFLPSKMQNTDSYGTDEEVENLAIGYALPMPPPNGKPMLAPENAQREPNTKLIEVKGTSAGGGYSTAIDLHKFSLALLNGKLIAPESVKTITSGKIALPKMPTPPNSKPMPEIKYGFGFGEFYKNNVRIIGHNGGAPGVDVQTDIYPELGYTVVVLSNYGRTVLPIINFIEDIITNPTGADF